MIKSVHVQVQFSSPSFSQSPETTDKEMCIQKPAKQLWGGSKMKSLQKMALLDSLPVVIICINFLLPQSHVNAQKVTSLSS